jgi:hypothetical protein
MPQNKTAFLLVCALAALASQSCVEYLPPPENSPPPAPAAYAPDEQQLPPQPPQQPAYAPTQYSEATPPAPPSQPSPNPALDNLLAPIALYPDALIALVLPASTVPNDISSAANYLVQYGDVSQIDSQPWDPSVRGLAHYPTVISWMASNLEWTQALGSAFSSDPNGVMDAVQRLRARAQAAGTLVNTPQQQVVSDDGEIDIEPAQDNVIYVPVYDPEVVYSTQPYYGYGGPFINFGEPYPSGLWLSYSFDWRSHRVWAGDREHDAWRQTHNGADHPPVGAHAWQPPSGVRIIAPPARTRGGNGPLPRPMPGAPNPPPEHYKRPGTNNVQPPPSQVNYHSYPPPQERPRLNAPPLSTPRQQLAPFTPAPAPSRVTLPPTNHGESAPVERQAPPASARPGTYVSPEAPPHAMPEHPSQPAREPRPPSAPARSAPAPAQQSSSSNQDPNKKN